MSLHTCPHCGSDLTEREVGDRLVAACTRCTWEAITHEPDSPSADETVYSVGIATAPQSPAEAAASLAVALGLSAHAAGDILTNRLPIAQEVGAVEVQRLHALLAPRGFALSISPAFPWALES